MDNSDKIKKLWENQLGINENTDSEEFPSLLPIAMKVAAKTISNDLFFGDPEKMKEIEKRIEEENRIGKIDSVINDKEYKEKRKEDDPDWVKENTKGVTPMSGPTGTLFYLDFNYGTSSTSF